MESLAAVLLSLPYFPRSALISQCVVLDLLWLPCALPCPQEQPLLRAVASVPPIQGIPLCVLFGSPPALSLHALHSSARIAARTHNKSRGRGTEGEGGVYHGQCSLVVIVAQTTGPPRPMLAMKRCDSSTRPIALALRFLPGAVVPHVRSSDG